MPDESSVLPPALTNAARWRGLVLGAAWGAGLAGPALVLGGAVARLAGYAGPGDLLGLAGASLLLAVSGLWPAAALLGGRERVVEAADAERLAQANRAGVTDAGAGGKQALFTGGADATDLLLEAERIRLLRLAGWPQLALALPTAALAGAAAWFFLPSAAGTPGLGTGLALLAVAFPALLIERRLSLIPASELPEAAPLARLARVVLWTLVVSGVCGIARELGFASAIWGQRAVALLLMAGVAEAVLRVLAAPFLPAANANEARGLVDIRLAGGVLPGGGGGPGQGLRERFGIDLSQSWALGFVRRAAGPLILALLVLAWLLTGVSAVNLGERGVYERNGSPVAVLRSGLHLHLPWPFGVIQRVDDGTVRQLALADDGGENLARIKRIAADADAPTDYDRVWTKEHAADALLVVPAPLGAGSTQQSSQLLNADVRVFYRIGLSDNAAMAALYALDRPEQAVRAAAGRLLVRLFAVRTLLDAIGENRERLASVLREALQKELDARASGIEVTAVALDALHPPKDAAAAYYGVQEAEISAAAEVADARRSAVRARVEGQEEAIRMAARGANFATAQLSGARVAATRFAGEQTAWKQSPQAMSFERWLQALSGGLSRAKLTVIDHRLDLVDGAVLDLRPYAPPTARDPKP